MRIREYFMHANNANKADNICVHVQENFANFLQANIFCFQTIESLSWDKNPFVQSRF